ncbi:MAG: hypothetical protein B5M54_10010 [Candidatus Aminicenantes bacterium 4484_214]|nr:MAG: hypothetical protein B5M54_10010 [Candidatus Aminicenantes bacterium 4484_214]
MKKEMRDLALWCLETAKKQGADDCGITLSRERFVNISYRNRKPETIKEASSMELSIEIYVNGRYSSQRTSDLRRDSLKKFIANAIVATKLLAEDPYRTLPDPKYFKDIVIRDLGLVDPAYQSFNPEKRHEIVKAIEDSCYSDGREKIISVTASEYDSYIEYFLLKSNGFEGYLDATVFQVGASVSLQDEGDRRPSEGHYAVAVKFKKLPSPEKVGQIALERTKALLGAKKIKTETIPVIIENRNVPRFLSGFLAGMYGSNIQQKSGVLKEFYIDWYYSRKLRWEPTTGSPTNLIIPPGKRSLPEITRDLGRCILITGFIGGNSNSTTGDTSIGIVGQLYEQGEPVQAISEMNVAGNHLSFWNNLVEVANDPWEYSAWRTPSLVFKDIVVSGL